MGPGAMLLQDIAERGPGVTVQVDATLKEMIDRMSGNGKGVVVVLEAEHSCMTIRGVRKPGSITITSAVRGLFLTNQSSRAEVMSLINRK